MEKIVAHGLLYDFYGELLTQHQRQIYEDAVYNDMSLAEIADIHGISRQGVHDLLKRCDRILEGYEQKLHLVERFESVKERVTQISRLTKELEETVRQDARTESRVCRIRELSNEILEEL